MRTLTAARQAAAILCLAAFAGVATPAQAAPRRCDTLRGAKVTTTAQARVVRASFDRVYRKGGTRVVGQDFLACERPRGKVRRIGQRYREYATTGSIKNQTPVDSGFTSLGTIAGRFVIVRTRESDLTGDFASRNYRVVDLRSGHSYPYFEQVMNEDNKQVPAPPATLRLDDRGRLAAILRSVDPAGSDPAEAAYSAPPPGRDQVVLFGPTGKRTVLEEAAAGAFPLTALQLKDDRVTWTNAGTLKSAPAGPGAVRSVTKPTAGSAGVTEAYSYFHRANKKDARFNRGTHELVFRTQRKLPIRGGEITTPIRIGKAQGFAYVISSKLNCYG